MGNDRQTEPTDNFWENLNYGCPDATIDENTDFNDILKFSFIYCLRKFIPYCKTRYKTYKKAISNDPCISSVAILTLTVKLQEYPFPESTPGEGFHQESTKSSSCRGSETR